MKRVMTFLMVLLLCSCMLLWGCASVENGGDEGQNLEFTVVSPEEIPKELAGILNTNKESEMMMSYKIEGYFYLVRGYGKQDTGGYSIAVNKVSLIGDEIYVDTSLLGPPAGEEIPKEPSCPYVVIKIEYMEKQVVFD